MSYKTTSGVVKPGNPRKRAPRFEMSKKFKVVSKTIGTHIEYPLNTMNVSNSGMQLAWQQRVPVPFRPNTLLEMTIDPEGGVLETPIKCLGRVVRRDDESSECPIFGVFIVQMEQEDADNWEICIKDLEATTPPMIDKRTSPTGGPIPA